MRKTTALLLAAVTSLSLAACSSDSSSPESTTTTIPGAIPEDLKLPYLRSLYVNHQAKGAHFQAVYAEQAMQLDGYVSWETGSGYVEITIASSPGGFAAWDATTLYASDDGVLWNLVDESVAAEQSVRGALYRLFGVVSKSAAKQPGNEALDLDAVYYNGSQDVSGHTYQSFRLSSSLTLFVDEQGHMARVFISEPAIPATVTLQFVSFEDTAAKVKSFFDDRKALKTLQETTETTADSVPPTQTS